MFKAFNPYQILAEEGMPVDRIRLGRSPELSQCRWVDGDCREWLSWEAFCQRIIPVRRKRSDVASDMNMSMGRYLLLHAEWVRGELDSLKTVGWDPTDDVRAWLSPYLPATSIGDWKILLDEDVELLRKMMPQD